MLELRPIRWHPAKKLGNRLAGGGGRGDAPRFEKRPEVLASGAGKADQPLVAFFIVGRGPLGVRQSAVVGEDFLVGLPTEASDDSNSTMLLYQKSFDLQAFHPARYPRGVSRRNSIATLRDRRGSW